MENNDETNDKKLMEQQEKGERGKKRQRKGIKH